MRLHFASDVRWPVIYTFSKGVSNRLLEIAMFMARCREIIAVTGILIVKIRTLVNLEFEKRFRKSFIYKFAIKFQ